ncbi:MAG: hypothetical protein M3Y72_06370 [Acidobacteriota bacterium]|nr:hypothetical protein [Acidobacteriota bacterium]
MQGTTPVVFAVAADGNLYLQWQTLTSWSGWGNLGSSGGGLSPATPAKECLYFNNHAVVVESGG